MFEKLKKRWGLTSNLQVVVILIVFSLAGSSLVWICEPVWHAIGITSESPLWVKILAIVFITIPLYQVMLMLWGTVFGQWRFFWEFEKKSFGRMFRKRTPKPAQAVATETS